MTTTKTFGEYLVEQKALSYAALLDVLMSQLRASPSVAEVVFQNQLLPEKSLVEVLSAQSLRGLDFASAARELGLWSETLEQSVWFEIEKTHKPLVQILVDKKHLGLTQVNKFLDSYLGEVADPRSHVAAPIAATVDSPVVLAVASAQSEAELPPVIENFVPPEPAAHPLAAEPAPVRESSDHLGGTPDLSVGVYEFASQFDLVNELQVFSHLEGIEDPANRKEMGEIFHRIAGVANFAKLPRLQAAFGLFEAIVERLGSTAGSATPEQLKMAKDALVKGFKVTCQLRDFILTAGAEEDFSGFSPETEESLRQCIEQLIQTDVAA